MEIRKQALEKLEHFCLNHLAKYSSTRNFDFGPEQRENTSVLSKYITHRVVDEIEVLKSSYSKFSYAKIEKFIQEVMWRTYWKGWLEMRPKVWQDYNKDLLELKKETKKNYLDAINAQTNVEPFNDWVLELKQTGYLHNHARMWFASVWIFTLNLPWQLGADFFLKNLLDGDAASNTLSWRWVAGLHTQGKHYVAAEWNINKFSKKKYKNLKLNETAIAKYETTIYETYPIAFDTTTNDQSLFLIHNLDSNFIQQNQTQSNHYGVMDFTSILQKQAYSENVINFKKNINNELKNLIKEKFNSEIYIDSLESLQKVIKEKNIKQVILPYLNVGYENDFIQSIKKEVNITYSVRDYDRYCWQFATKGFFKFKEQIPKVLAKFLT